MSYFSPDHFIWCEMVFEYFFSICVSVQMTVILFSILFSHISFDHCITNRHIRPFIRNYEFLITYGYLYLPSKQKNETEIMFYSYPPFYCSPEAVYVFTENLLQFEFDHPPKKYKISIAIHNLTQTITSWLTNNGITKLNAFVLVNDIESIFLPIAHKLLYRFSYFTINIMLKTQYTTV